ncbi:hypothetical protein KAR48_18160 [bacterium]|nr:hypothetical protein [bacterium]
MIHRTAVNHQALAWIAAKYKQSVQINEKVIPPQYRTVTEVKEVEETYFETETVDKGPSPLGWQGLAVSAVVSIVLGFNAGLAVGIIAMIIGGGLSTILLFKMRKFEHIEVPRTRKVNTQIEKKVKVTDAKKVRERVKGPFKVKYVGVGSIPFSCRKTSLGKLVVGPQELMKTVSFDYPVLENFPSFNKETATINKRLQAIPWIMQGEKTWVDTDEATQYGARVPLYDIEKAIHTYLNKTARYYKHHAKVPIQVSAVKSKAVLSLLRPSGPAGSQPIETLKKIQEVLDSPGGRQLDRVLGKWKRYWVKVNVALFQARSTSIAHQVAPECFDFGNTSQYMAFHFYCPTCNQSQSESLLKRNYSVQNQNRTDKVSFSVNTRCKRIDGTDVWVCKTCQNKTGNPIPVHRMLDEIIMPVYEFLLEEHKLERLKAHTRIREKELGNNNKIEKELDLANDTHLTHLYRLTEEMERFQAEIMGQNEALGSMNTILNEFKLSQERVLQGIQEHSRQTEAQVARQTAQVISEIDQFKEQRMATYAQEMNTLAGAQRLEDEKRDQVQRDILEGVKSTVEAVNHNTEVIGGKLDTLTEVNRDGFNMVGNKLDETNSKLTDIKDGVNNLGVKMDVQTERLGKGLDNINDNVKKGNSIQAARAKAEGINLHDEKGILQIGKKLNNFGIDLKGKFLGQSSMETEEAKLHSN